MKITAIVYTSNTGYTREYAAMLGEKTGLAVYSLKEASAHLPAGAAVLYLGWIMAGRIQGYAKAAKRFRVAAVCGVGMSGAESQLQDVRKANTLPPSLPTFILQGGFDMKRLRGVYKWMMAIMAGTLGRTMRDKADRTAEQEDMLDLLENGGSRVSEQNLAAVLRWYIETSA